MGFSPQQWDRIKQLYESALEHVPASRGEFLQHAEDDPIVRDEVLRLLGEYENLGDFLSAPPFQTGSVSPADTQRRFAPGQVLTERFRVSRFIAAGGMGEVYEAEDLTLKENVAIKTIRPEVMQQNNALARFKREVQLARKVTHRNICRVFDLFWHRVLIKDTDDTIFFVSMELLQGEPLSDLIRRTGRLHPEHALPLIEQIADGLEAAHRAGIVHRDLKPGNVMLVSESGNGLRCVITDFGLAFRTDSDANRTADLTASQGVLGTPAYMSPEQIEGKEVTKQTDIYALGLVIYEMVTGKPAFPADTPLASIAKKLSDSPVPPKQFAPELTDSWEQTIKRCLQIGPADRYPSALEVAKALSRQPLEVVSPSQLRANSQPRKGDSVWASFFEKQHFPIKRLLRTAGLCGLIVATMLGYRLWHEYVTTPKENLTLRQLTASTRDNFIEYGLISPDGKYLVYTVKGGSLFLSSVETGETRVLDSSAGGTFPQAWFPGGSQLLVTKWGDGHLWKLSVLTGKLSRLGSSEGSGGDGSVSPDGLHILYTSNDDLWIMGSDGQAAHRIMAVDSTDSLGDFQWAPTGQRFVYSINRRRPDGKENHVIESRDIEGRQQAIVIVSSTDLVSGGALWWLADGRIVFSLSEPPPNQEDSNLWTIDVDPVTGRARGSPQRLTNWMGFATTDISSSATGKQLVFMKTHSQRGIFIAPVAPNQKSRLSTIDRLTTDTWGSRADGWTLDSRAIYITSNKSGRFGIYRQNVRQQVSEPVITGPEDYYDAQLSADGASLLYTASAKRENPELARLMSVPIEGGSPLLLAKGSSEYQCALPPSKICVMSKHQGNQREFYLLDPRTGLQAKPFQTTGNIINWSLSPDGGQIAMADEADTSLRILSVTKGTSRRLDLGTWNQQARVQYLSWFPNGEGLYLTAFLPSGTTLLSVTRDGNITTLFQQGHDWVCCPKVAPNGRVLAFSVSEFQRDVEMIENF